MLEIIIVSGRVEVLLICYMLFIQYYIFRLSVILVTQRMKQIETW